MTKAEKDTLNALVMEMSENISKSKPPSSNPI